MDFKKTTFLFLFVIFFWTLTNAAHAFPPQSIEFLPGYKVPDVSSDGAPSYDLRYFLHFPSLYLAAGVGIGHINAPANHKNLAIGSDVEMTPIGFTLRVFPSLSESYVTFLEIGVDRLSQLGYKLDPSIDTGQTDVCFTDTSTGPSPCKKTTIRRKSYAYRFGAGIEKVFRSGFGVGLHYTYRQAEPISKTVSQTQSVGVQAPVTTSEDLFDIKQSIFSILISYRFR
ncbi:MAG: hypothetical protein EPO39_07855 [Candidatus Manganitrophaceae bacterium]|nr:MAG: hypothetical protein EPO39_07855 [Candidatus Manganitrophaceae bacterium]